ncbi:hypothetical protein BDW02DRAFT_637396 [Decorospora gaudefroyi]|uniref:Uncharacterized protein n=1 Tax=Decorospora gaudefroyi TaxID=184978 RepID=A0A6A5KN45_9PLEO|nr:hypothetical protein BDW02DRAFT_637396 [Decorospora gaudefroyi]
MVTDPLPMATSSGSVFGETLQTITITKLEDLAKQRAAFEEEYAALLDAAKAEEDSLKRVYILVEGTKSCLGIKTDSKKADDGRTGRVVFGGTRNVRLETDLRNLDRFLEQARFDPSVSAKVLEDWEKKLLEYLSVQSTKFQYADLYGKLVTEWLSSEKPTASDDDTVMTESFEEVPGAKKIASRTAWEKDVFRPGDVDAEALKSYLEELFITDKKQGPAAILELRKKVEEFESSLNSSSNFNEYTLRSTIQGLQESDLLSNEKRETLKDFLSNEVILHEICDILNLRMMALDRWTWGPFVLLEQRRKLNGDFTIHFDPDLLQAIFLHYIGVKWSVFFKSAFLNMHKHDAWARNSTEVPKADGLRRSYFLGPQGTAVFSSLEDKRRSMHHNRYFAQQLLDYENQKSEAVEGEEEAEYRNYVDVTNKRLMVSAPMAQQAQLQQQQQRAGPMNQMTMQSAARQLPPMPMGMGDGDDEVSEEYSIKAHHPEDEKYRRQSKKPMETKQSLIHLVSTEIILNTRLHGELTCFRTTFDSWNPLLPHQTLFTVLEFLGVSKKWKKFFENYLQAPLKFMDDPSSEPRLRRRGMPGSHTLSDVLGETVLFCLDFAVNQATDDYDVCTNAWAAILRFTEVMGVKLDDKKTGSVRISQEKNLSIDDRLPEGEIRWGFLRLDSKRGRFEIDQKMVDGHVEELRTQLEGKSKSVIDYIQAWNSYAATFFSSNFGKASNCFGREHVDKMLAIHRHIQDSIFPGSSVVQYLKKMIEKRFSVKNVPDGFLFFPVELGGLDLKSPFVDLLQIRESVKENPYDFLDEYEEKERDDYAALKRKFDQYQSRSARANTKDTNWETEAAYFFFPFEEFIKYREVFASIGKANLVHTYAALLERPQEAPVNDSQEVRLALANLSGRSNLRGITFNWNSMNAYWKWIAQMYGPEMIQTFGGLNVVDFGLLPIGMVSMFRQRRTKWQG